MNSTVSQWAKETVQKMMTENILPTPENYQKIYAEISGTKEHHAFPQKELRELNNLLELKVETELTLLATLENAVLAKDWQEYFGVWRKIIVHLRAVEALEWNKLLEKLLRALDAHHVYFTVAKKREMLKKILNKSDSPSVLFQKIENLIQTWGDTKTEESLVEEETEEEKKNREDAERLQNLRQLLSSLLTEVIQPFLIKNEDLLKACANLVRNVVHVKTDEEHTVVKEQLKRLRWQMELFVEEQNAQQEGIFKLVRLLIENMEVLSVDDEWLSGQLRLVQEVIEKPLSLRVLGEAERRLADVLYKQGQMKIALLESRGSLTALLAGFVEQIAEFSESTSDYHDKLNLYAQQISQSKDVTELDSILNEVMKETRLMQKSTKAARDELTAAKQRVAKAQKRIGELEKTLEETSNLITHDTLTGVLNRRGLDGVMSQEIARALRAGQKLSVGLLDVDNFKKLNDHYGHNVGDQALQYLSNICKNSLRPHDSIARYGGEEFVIILPGADAQQGQAVLQRLQRALTKEIFMHNNEKLLITFSAGVTELRKNDVMDDILKRADSAMYAAKNSGKNRVLVAL